MALFLYALLPIIRNTYTGIENVDSAIIEAGRGMGLTGRQILYMVETPSCYSRCYGRYKNIYCHKCGMLPHSALLWEQGGSASSYSEGISMINSNMILAGAVPAALLALSLDYILGLM